MNSSHLKQGLLAFWCLWFAVVFASNLCDGLRELGILPGDWPFASGNFRYIVSTTARYHTPIWMNGLMFVGVFVWEGTAALLFGIAAAEARQRPIAQSRFLYPAFIVGLSLWSAFMLADEVCIAYAVEATHLRLFVAQLLSLLTILLLPERRESM